MCENTFVEQHVEGIMRNAVPCNARQGKNRVLRHPAFDLIGDVSSLTAAGAIDESQPSDGPALVSMTLPAKLL